MPPPPLQSAMSTTTPNPTDGKWYTSSGDSAPLLVFRNRIVIHPYPPLVNGLSHGRGTLGDV